jgi:SAM-dependent methyltransferase
MNAMQECHDVVSTEPNSLVVGLLENFPELKRGSALDLGAGNMRDAKYLLNSGFRRVTAIDISPDSLPHVRRGIEFIQGDMRNYQPETRTFDLVIACNSLFYLTKEEVRQLFVTLYQSLQPEGLFAFNVLGPDDPLTQNPGTSFFTRHEIFNFADGFAYFEVGYCETRRTTKMPDGGTTYSHTFGVILQAI